MTDAPAQQSGQASKARVFISYSRKDITFADRLDAALKARGFEPLIDRTDIYAFEEWWKRVEDLIARADTVVFVLSPDAVRPGSVSLKEVEFAASLNKRFAPIVFRPVQDKDVPEALAKLNFIFFDDMARFEQSADKLGEALNTDISWIRHHTDFGEQARRWALAKGPSGPSGLLLRSPVLEQAERWIAARPSAAPAPTEETQAFIRRSRQGASRRRNILTSSLAAGLVLALSLAALAYWQRGVAVEQERVAQEQRKSAEEQRRIADEQRKLAEEQRDALAHAQANILAERSAGKLSRSDFDSALRLASRGVRIDLALPADKTRASPAVAALAAAVSQVNWRFALVGHDDAVWSPAFSPDGSRIVTASDDKTARIWDAARAKEIALLRGHDSDVYSAAFSPDGSRIVTASLDTTARIWDAATAKEIAVLRGHDSNVWSAAFSPDGSRIVTASWDKTARIWDAATAREIAVLRGHDRPASSAAFRPDGSRIVTASEDKTARIWDAHLQTMPVKDLLAEACVHLAGVTKLTREEMRLAGYPDSMSEIDICTSGQ
jgi:TIR domain/WD domain, G-beta repeat